MSQILVQNPHLKLFNVIYQLNALLQMEKNDLIPEVLDKEPLATLQVKYEGKLIYPGKMLRPKTVKLVPDLQWNTNNNDLYTILMIDPDCPSRRDHKFREFLHWLVVNVPENRIKSGQTIVEYVGAAPPKGSGLHRYVILVFKQNGRIKCEERHISIYCAAGRTRFSNKAFARKYNLQEIVAGTIFLSEWDEYVPQLHRQMQIRGC